MHNWSPERPKARYLNQETNILLSILTLWDHSHSWYTNMTDTLKNVNSFWSVLVRIIILFAPWLPWDSLGGRYSMQPCIENKLTKAVNCIFWLPRFSIRPFWYFPYLWVDYDPLGPEWCKCCNQVASARAWADVCVSAGFSIISGDSIMVHLCSPHWSFCVLGDVIITQPHQFMHFMPLCVHSRVSSRL